MSGSGSTCMRAPPMRQCMDAQKRRANISAVLPSSVTAMASPAAVIQNTLQRTRKSAWSTLSKG